ncbi:ribonuclease P protein component [Halolactibacillus alkaliphilus]|uniref:Ribonuclease P protein component n=1 Tax=Halolactibacillus alkaliphilus TaxID=442899 RepID=A0A511X0D1_9BACI|nr:ribonuclease P protein component [Halolactibacillus alkaliphilus]GEN56409.1 ribonuclease P protein component [Halolactibacillus alkaliphilus]GGN64582.1 ribonuclease P protein component [Halolactibacillus alkaliphilus]SFO60805.1 ribonuclease P protein component [Halolactibacillus alkaliphilus]
MKKAYRLKSNDDFQQVFKRGTSFANRQLVLYYLPKQDQTHFRIGLSVSKKVGNAVVRNRIKRYLRQAFHELDQDVKQAYDFVIIARVPTKDLNFHEMKKSLTHVLFKSKLFKQVTNKNVSHDSN